MILCEIYVVQETVLFGIIAGELLPLCNHGLDLDSISERPHGVSRKVNYLIPPALVSILMESYYAYLKAKGNS